MRIAIISPFSHGPARGNVITVQRIASAFERAGHETTVLPVDAMGEAEISARLASYMPEVILAFHAYYCGEFACRLAGNLSVPIVVTLTGGDINEPGYRAHSRTQFALDSADAIVCFDNSMVSLLTECRPETVGRVTVIPQAVDIVSVSAFQDSRIPADAFVVLIPATLRPVKNVEFPLKALTSLAQEHARLLLVIAGGILDRDYAETVSELIAASPFAVWLGEVPHDRMGDLYQRADVVLNCSHYEGMPNSLLEAMAMGRPVIAVDIPGNRSLVRDRETGWLYRGEDELRLLVRSLLEDPLTGEKAGRNAMARVRSEFSPDIEAERYIELFKSLGAWSRLNTRERCCK